MKCCYYTKDKGDTFLIPMCYGVAVHNDIDRCTCKNPPNYQKVFEPKIYKMKLIKGKQYSHKSGFVGTFSHSDELNYNHFFRAKKIPKHWTTKPKNGLIDFPTWDIQRSGWQMDKFEPKILININRL